MENLLQIISSLPCKDNQYYRIEDLACSLQNISKTVIVSGDMILLPFYITEKRLELYDYELDIRVVDRPSFDIFIQRKIGRSKKDIDPKIINKIYFCYIEALQPEKLIKIDRLNEYIDFLFSSEELTCRISDLFETCKTQNYYFEVY